MVIHIGLKLNFPQRCEKRKWGRFIVRKSYHRVRRQTVYELIRCLATIPMFLQLKWISKNRLLARHTYCVDVGSL